MFGRSWRWRWRWRRDIRAGNEAEALAVVHAASPDATRAAEEEEERRYMCEDLFTFDDQKCSDYRY